VSTWRVSDAQWETNTEEKTSRNFSIRCGIDQPETKARCYSWGKRNLREEKKNEKASVREINCYLEMGGFGKGR